MKKSLLSTLSPEEKRVLENSIASFEIEGIEISDVMLSNAIKILKGETSAKELNARFIDSLKGE